MQFILKIYHTQIKKTIAKKCFFLRLNTFYCFEMFNFYFLRKFEICRSKVWIEFYIFWISILQEVNAQWSGLGYYSRGKRLHMGAQKVSVSAFLLGKLRTVENIVI